MLKVKQKSDNSTTKTIKNMEILSHRGWWDEPSDKNSKLAFLRALNAGFGLETDVRESLGELVVSHDPPRGDEISFELLLSLYCQIGGSATLALNIKADGLQAPLAEMLSRFRINNYFVFDMSSPELVRYHAAEIQYYTRISDLETEPVGLTGATGLWVDGFGKDWEKFDDLTQFVRAGKKLAIVSPELHKRPHLEFWSKCKEWWNKLPDPERNAVQLCTDLPDQAKRYFYE
jgi:hypothetical protein